MMRFIEYIMLYYITESDISIHEIKLFGSLHTLFVDVFNIRPNISSVFKLIQEK